MLYSAKELPIITRFEREEEGEEEEEEEGEEEGAGLFQWRRMMFE
jgi:CO dehydrogenase/acetyl-CoA synthase beta subunit